MKESAAIDLANIEIDFLDVAFGDTITPSPELPTTTVHDDGWTAPVAFDEFDLPAFPVEVLPPTLRAFVEHEATATQTPVDLVAMLVLPVVAAAVAKKVEIEAWDGWREPINLYTATALPVASRKTAVVRDVTAPIEEYEAERAASMKEKIIEAAQALRIKQKVLAQLEDRAAKATAESDRKKLIADAAKLAAEIETTKLPIAPRFMADDVTPEKLVSLLAAHDGRMAVISPEGGPFDMMAGRYSDKPNFEVYLKGHPGDEIRVDRTNRPSEHIKKPAVTLGLAVQPDVFHGLASIPGGRGRGLLGRFLYALPKSNIGTRAIRPPAMPVAVAAAYAKALRALLAWEPGRTEDGQLRPIILKLTPEAQELLREFMAWLEPRLAEFGEYGLIQDWAGKLGGAILRIAGILRLNNQFSDSSIYMDKPVITGEDISASIVIGRYLTEHAKAVFGLMGADEDIENAKHLLRCITKQGWQTFKERDLFNAVKGDQRFNEVAKLAKPLSILTARSFIRLADDGRRDRRGRSASPTYEVNPHNSQNSQNTGTRK
ncbi:MAG: hypothetical protein JWM53_6421 [bacterium]|nr:hypothetical protein [bacterium]